MEPSSPPPTLALYVRTFFLGAEQPKRIVWRSRCILRHTAIQLFICNAPKCCPVHAERRENVAPTLTGRRERFAPFHRPVASCKDVAKSESVGLTSSRSGIGKRRAHLAWPDKTGAGQSPHFISSDPDDNEEVLSGPQLIPTKSPCSFGYIFVGTTRLLLLAHFYECRGLGRIRLWLYCCCLLP